MIAFTGLFAVETITASLFHNENTDEGEHGLSPMWCNNSLYMVLPSSGRERPYSAGLLKMLSARWMELNKFRFCVEFWDFSCTAVCLAVLKLSITNVYITFCSVIWSVIILFSWSFTLFHIKAVLKKLRRFDCYSHA